MDLTKLGFESIEGKVIFITGASNGIGRATALLLAGLGAKLIVAARREEKLRELAAEIDSNDVFCLKLDVQDENACNTAVEKAIEHFGRIDVLVNNAGLGIPTPDLSETDTADYQAMMKTNVDGIFFLTRAVLQKMKQAGQGHVVNVSSTAGVAANPVAPLYCTSKFALEGYNEGLHKQAANWRKEGINIRVSNVKPGSVDSGYWGDRDVPRHKFMSCEEMAAVLFWTIAAQKTMNITEIRMETVR
jgi:NADP-dependent 3-hydroxy acid dehydrogenase YdfG